MEGEWGRDPDVGTAADRKANERRRREAEQETPRHRGLHRRSYGHSSSKYNRKTLSENTDTPGGVPLADGEELKGRGGGTYSETTVRILPGSRRHTAAFTQSK